jgi:enoyl-[acyl-carrier protein] reductase II
MKFSKNPLCQLLGTQYPIIQGGMIWCSGWRLASAVSNEGGLGIIGAGSMYPEVFREHIRKCKAATDKPFGVNLPLLYADLDQLIDIIREEGVKIIITSAGNPKAWTSRFKEMGCTVLHVVASQKFARKAEEAGVDGLIAEGFEAGGHNGREEITTFNLIPAIRSISNLPLAAAGGVYSGASILGAIALGADGVQIGSLFALSEESSAHENFKNLAIHSAEGDTKLLLKSLHPVRLLNSVFSREVEEAEARGAGKEELEKLLGRARAKKGMFEGNLEEGELEIGQNAAYIRQILPVKSIFATLLRELETARQAQNARCL